MRKWQKYGITVGILFLFAIGGYGIGINVFAAEKAAETVHTEVILSTAREIENVTVILNTYLEELNSLAENPGDGEEPPDDGSGENIDTPDDETTPTTPPVPTPEEIDAYFDNSVFVGDSIMLGFRNYAMKRQETFLSRLNFLAAGSFSANNALWEVNAKSVHPVYQGEQRQIWESISLMGAEKVFLMLGMNDLNITGLEGSRDVYKELIEKIKESSPDAEINIMSMTYVLNGKEKGKLENDTIREYNTLLQQMAEENGWGFVNIADALADENGDLAEEYCSDDFAHQNPAAYDIWVSILRQYAGERLVYSSPEL